MSLPSILFGRAIITTNKTNIEKIQRIENKVWRYLLGIGGYSTVETLRGEIGASMVKSRVMETMLLFLVDTLASEFTNIKNMMTDTLIRRKGKWFNTINEYRQELNISWDQLKKIDRQSLKKMVRKYDTEKWREGLSKKTSLRIYNLEKKDIGYEFCYRNNSNSRFLATARTNALQLEEHKGRGQKNYNTDCKLCRE